MPDRERWPTSAAPVEWKWWTRANVILLVLFLGLGFVVSDARLAGVVIAVAGATQVYFGGLLLANRAGFADRVAEYYSHRPRLLGGYFPNTSARSQRLSGVVGLVGGFVAVMAGIWVATR
jgi:hypothetical protein